MAVNVASMELRDISNPLAPKKSSTLAEDASAEVLVDEVAVATETVVAREQEESKTAEENAEQHAEVEETAGEVAAHSAALMTEAANFLNAGAAALGGGQYIQTQQQYTATKYTSGGALGTAGSITSGLGATEYSGGMLGSGMISGGVAASGMTNMQSRTTYMTGTPTVSGAMVSRTYESTGTTPISGHTRVLSGYGKTTGGMSTSSVVGGISASGAVSGMSGATYQSRRITASSGMPVMTGASYSQQQTVMTGGAYQTGYSTTTSDNIVSQSRGVETLQSERVVSSNVVSEALMGPMPMEEDVQYIEVPVVEEVVKHVPRREVVEVEKLVPKYEYQWVEKIVEIPQIQVIERQVEVPEYFETVRTVPKIEVVDRPYEVIKRVPKYETKIVEQRVEVPGEIIEIPKPYPVENRIIVPRYTNAEVPVVVAQSLVPRISESIEDFVDVELSEYVPKLVTVDVYVPKPVQRPLLAKGRYDEHRVVDIPVAHFNGLLKTLNFNLTEEELRTILIKEESGNVALAPVAGPLVAPVSNEWEAGHVSGQLHYTTATTATTITGVGATNIGNFTAMPSVGTLGSTVGNVLGSTIGSVGMHGTGMVGGAVGGMTQQKTSTSTTTTSARQIGGAVGTYGASAGTYGISGGVIEGAASHKAISSISSRAAGQTISSGMQASGMQTSSGMQMGGMQMANRGIALGTSSITPVNLGVASQRQWGTGAQFSSGGAQFSSGGAQYSSGVQYGASAQYGGSAQYGARTTHSGFSGSLGFSATTPKMPGVLAGREHVREM